MEEHERPMGQGLDHILTSVQQYEALNINEKATPLLPAADDKLLSGEAGHIYRKRTGHRALTVEDCENIILALGTDQEKDIVTGFNRAQQALSERLTRTKSILKITDEAQLNYGLYKRRRDNPGLWTPDEIKRVVEVLKKHHL